MRERGTAQIDVASGLVGVFASHLPRAFAIVGTERADHANFCRFIVASSEIAAGAHVVMAMEISDVGMTKTVSLSVRPPENASA